MKSSDCIPQATQIMLPANSDGVCVIRIAYWSKLAQKIWSRKLADISHVTHHKMSTVRVRCYWFLSNKIGSVKDSRRRPLTLIIIVEFSPLTCSTDRGITHYPCWLKSGRRWVYIWIEQIARSSWLFADNDCMTEVYLSLPEGWW